MSEKKEKKKKYRLHLGYTEKHEFLKTQLFILVYRYG